MNLDMCSCCKQHYPDVGYVTDMFTSEQGYLHVCGICALAITNELHGTDMTEFHGEMAEQMRQDCIAYRAQFGADKIRHTLIAARNAKRDSK